VIPHSAKAVLQEIYRRLGYEEVSG
jgi:hypothetical protein